MVIAIFITIIDYNEIVVICRSMGIIKVLYIIEIKKGIFSVSENGRGRLSHGRGACSNTLGAWIFLAVRKQFHRNLTFKFILKKTFAFTAWMPASVLEIWRELPEAINVCLICGKWTSRL